MRPKLSFCYVEWLLPKFQALVKDPTLWFTVHNTSLMLKKGIMFVSKDGVITMGGGKSEKPFKS